MALRRKIAILAAASLGVIHAQLACGASNDWIQEGRAAVKEAEVLVDVRTAIAAAKKAQ